MSRLSSHCNVYNTCLRIIRNKGYKLRLEGELDEEEMIIPESLLWFAEKGEYDFLAANPIELLGLVSIHEHVEPKVDKPYWWTVPGDDIRDELYEQAFPDDENEDQQ
ncbi:hypothetical protein [Candidatus Uabimicrobium amorphum]|uniref:Uncharacterized protein n=1 Tax=Uabimicrobium amorphum TaxID=2596890 RepID=A0A5S9IPM7_UABAM|nr:hypothetical protein [Candidatus Uabimicrobium amorphum]BBM84375.1 hypothetical protein UABAM_02734 [Candidatus Uabimicrobium amorphum]